MSARSMLRGVGPLLAVAGLAGAHAAAGPIEPPASAVARAGGKTGDVVTGCVLDSEGSRVAGAEVQLVELGRQIRTESDGGFRFTAVPAGRHTLRVRHPPFAAVNRSIRVPGEESIEITLDADLRFQDEVSVTATPWVSRPLETAQQVGLVAAEDARRENVASVGEALASVPGMAFIPTGNALGTPVIRGISGHRIRVMNDGIALNHQQNSWRHSPNVEPAFADRLELVQGPASVLYGPDAMGGVINVVHAPLPFAADGGRVLHGEIAPSFSSNAAEWTGRGRLEGAHGGLGFRLDVLRRAGDDIETPSKTLENTDYAQTNAAVTVGHSGSWGNVRLCWHHWEDETGFYRPAGFRLDLHDDLFVADARAPTRAGVFELLASRQQNRRTAFPSGLSGPPGVDLDLVTLTGRLGFEHRPLGMLRGRVAVEYTGLDNEAIVGQLVPDYEGDGFALMAYEDARLWPSDDGGFDRVVLSLGMRWDTQRLDMAPFPAWQLGPRVTRDYSAVTGALGAVVRLGRDVALAGSLARGWRPPNAFELFARGEHGGVAAFQLGNPDLVEESNVNGEIDLRYEGRRLRGRISAYRNQIDDYIYLADSGDVEAGLPVFVHRQGDARIQGIETKVEAALLELVRVGLGYASIDTRNKATSGRLPQTPPRRLLATLRFERDRMARLSQVFLEVDGAIVGKGTVSGPDEPLGTPTDAYQVFDLKAGLTVPLGGKALGIDIAVRNLLDTEYTDFLWSYKPFASNPGRDVRVVMSFSF